MTELRQKMIREMDLKNPYDFSDKVAVLTGGAGVLCSTMARALSACGAKIAILDINLEGANQLAAQLSESGGEAIAIRADVLDKASIEEGAKQVLDTVRSVFGIYVVIHAVEASFSVARQEGDVKRAVLYLAPLAAVSYLVFNKICDLSSAFF